VRPNGQDYRRRSRTRVWRPNDAMLLASSRAASSTVFRTSARVSPFPAHLLSAAPYTPRQTRAPTHRLASTASESVVAALHNHDAHSAARERATKREVLERVMNAHKPGADVLLRCACSCSHARRPGLTRLGQVLSLMLPVRLVLVAWYGCLELTASAGNVATHDGQFKKSALCAEHHLDVRPLLSRTLVLAVST
jgi:hypothetical protein